MHWWTWSTLLAAEEKKASHVVLLDYQKAYDYMDHTVLVTKCKIMISPILSFEAYVHFGPIGHRG